MFHTVPTLPPADSGLRRPRLLMRAARIGLAEYRRDRDLRRILPQALLPAALLTAVAPPDGLALDWLMTEEARIEAARLAASASYSPLRHIEVMIALLAELRLTRTASTAAP